MDPAAVLSAYDEQMRRNPPDDGPGRIERTDRIVRHLSVDGQGWCGVVWSDLSEQTAAAEIEAQKELFTGLGRRAEWKHYSHDRPADLAERLAAAGFVAEPPEALMVAEIAALPTDMVLPDGVTLQPVTDEIGIAAMVRAADGAFGGSHADMGLAIWDHLRRDPTGMAVAVVLAGDRPVSGGRIELPADRDFASVWGGGTVPDWRRRGIYRALLAWRTAIAAERGYRWLQVDATPDSEPILRRLGFQRLATTTPYVLAR